MNRKRLVAATKRQHLGYRGGALALALLLWVFVVSENEYTYVIQIPIEARNLSAQKAHKKEVPRTAQVRVRGTGRNIFKSLLLKNFVSDFKLVLDLERISEEYDFILNEYFERYPQKVVIPSSFGLEYVEVVYPHSIHISLDENLVKAVPVKVGLHLELRPGYTMVDPPRLIPDTVKVAGPKEVVQTIEYVMTKRDTLWNVETPISMVVPLMTSSSHLLEYSHNSVHFYQNVQAISERIISEIPVEVVNIYPGLRVFVNPSTVALTVVGGVDRIAEIRPEDIRVTIDFSEQWRNKQQFYEPRVVVPEGVISWQDLSPRNVELVVTKAAN